MIDGQNNSLLGKIAAYTEILSSDPRSTIFVSLSESYRKMGMLDEARSVAETGLSHLPDYAPGNVVLARIKCQQGDMAASEACFKKALYIDPDSLAALVGYSRLCLLLDKKGDARKLLLTARELSPADSVINKLLLSLPEEECSATSEDEFVDDQEESTEDVTLTAVSEPLETATLAELYLKQGLVDQAVNIYKNLLVRDPDNLTFRRRIRDIELLPNGTTESPDVSSSVVDEVAPPVINSDSVEADTFVSDNSVETFPSVSSVEKVSVLDQLNGLLVSIQKRRGDV